MSSLRTIFAVVVSYAIVSPSPSSAAESTKDAFPVKGTFFEEVLTVQADRSKPVAPTNGTVSIPYTRVDVAIDNAVAITRVIQTYHNHGTNSAGYAFTMPIERDTMITQFNLWDQGERYAGAIEERTRAEKVYKEVTGEEAPTMNRDPGIVRTTGDRFEMRVFPILTEETKQIELVSHQRLSMDQDSFKFRIPLETITQPRDERHGHVKSQLTEVSVFIKDDLPLKKVAVTGGMIQETKLDEHRRLFRIQFAPDAIKDIEVSYEVEFSKPSVATPMTFTQGTNHFFLLRLLSHATPVIPPQTTASRPFYVGVWRNNSKVFKGDLEDLDIGAGPMTLEIVAAQTLTMLNQTETFHGSYTPLRVEGEHSDPMFRVESVATAQPYAVSNFWLAMEDCFKPLRGKEGESPKPVPAPDVMKHLRDAIEKDGCRLVYLFLYDLATGQSDQLTKIINANPKVTFLLVSKSDSLPAALTSPKNVSHYSLEGGWKTMKHSLADSSTQCIQLQEWSFDEFSGFAGTDMSSLTRFWEKLPNLGPYMPRLRTKGNTHLRDLQAFFGAGPRRGRVTARGGTDLLWMTGRFEISGKATLDVCLSPFPFEPWELRHAESKPLIQFQADVELKTGNTGSLFVGSFHARRLVERINAQISLLNSVNSSRSRKSPSDEQKSEDKKKIEGLRKEAVRLSRMYSFISAETAFIALPEELQKKYGITPQQIAASQVYNTKSMTSGTVPEPSEALLCLLGFAILRLVHNFSESRSRVHP